MATETKTVEINGKLVKLARVASLRPVGPRHVYDLEVRDHHNYVAQNISVHNCDYHQMLTEMGRKYSEELFRMKDVFLSYKHRRLIFYPSGPDKRVLRGRTRILACLTGDQLVSTNAGLIRMDQERLVGLRTNSCGSTREIVNQAPTGRKEVFRIRTRSGIELKATANHQFRCATLGRTGTDWVRVDQFTSGHSVMISLGGEFPATSESAQSVLEASRADTIAYVRNPSSNPYIVQQLLIRLGHLLSISRIRARHFDLDQLLEGPIQTHTFDPIVSIESIGEQEVYDITVDAADHEFTVNGVVSHNSIDELGWFDNNAMSAKVKVNGHEVYNALGRSLLTIRAKADQLMERRIYNVPTGYFLNISSPSSVRDKIMELVKLSQSSVKLYGIQRPTWEMNPNVPRSALAEEFRADPVTAMRDYGAQPPLSSSPFIGDKDTVTGIIGPRKNPCIYIHAQRKSKTSGAASRYAYISKLKKNGRPSCLAIDAGFSNNSFACVVGSLIGPKMVSLDVMIEVMPLPGVPLNYNKIYNEIMGPIIDSRNVQLTAADRWNSLKILHDIEEEYEINTRQYSVRYQDMQLFKSYCEDKQLLMPHPESADVDSVLKYDHSQYPKTFQGRPIDHFVLQMLTVQDTGASVIKGDQLTDDLVRASMLCTTMLLDEKNAELWERPDKEVAVAQQGPFAYMRGMSGGGGRSSGAGAAGNVSSQAVGFTKSLK